MITAFLFAISVAGGGCSDIRRGTFEVELTTERDPHVVKLWYNPKAHSNELRPAYRLEFPQSYYGYRDNHHYLNQTAIALLLEKPNLAPLAEVVAKQANITEPLSVLRFKQSALKPLVWGPYKDRHLWVVIQGLTGRPPLNRGDMPRVFASTPVVYHDLDSGFDIVEEVAKGGMGGRFPMLRGYSSEGQVIRMYCSSGVPNCSFETEFRNSYVSFVLPRSEAVTAHTIAPKLINLIEHHIVKDEE